MGSIKQKSRVRRKKKQLKRHKRSILLIGAAIVALIVVVGISSISLNNKSLQYQEQEAELKTQLKEEQDRTKDVEKFKDYVESDEYIADTAKSKLGLADPNEIILKPQE